MGFREFIWLNIYDLIIFVYIACSYWFFPTFGTKNPEIFEKVRQSSFPSILFNVEQLNHNCFFKNLHIWKTSIIFIQVQPVFEKKIKNPCFYDTCHQNGTGTSRRLRCLPFFHILGVDKCGSTDLYNRLVSHPQIIPNSGVLDKEPSWWSWRRYGKQIHQHQYHDVHFMHVFIYHPFVQFNLK